MTVPPKAAAALQLVEDCYRFQLCCRFGPLAARASLRTAEPAGLPMLAACLDAVVAAGQVIGAIGGALELLHGL